MEKITYCHHCDRRIVWNKLDGGGGYWAHAIPTPGHPGIGNATMVQRCDDGINWATPARKLQAPVPMTAEEHNAFPKGRW